MLGRALSSATLALLIGCFAAAPGQAENLEAGKSPSQLFADTCNACHKSPRGLLKTVSVGALPGFLREHYTTSGDMAKLLSDFLIANGASDKRNAGAQTKQAKDAKPDGKPDTDGLSPPGEPGRQGRNAKRLASPGEVPEGARSAADGHVPAQAAIERGPDGRKLSAKQKLTKRGRPGSEELPKTGADVAKDEPSKDEPSKDEPSKGEPSKDEPVKDLSKIEAPKEDGSEPEVTTPAAEGKAGAAKVDALKETGSGETPALRPDPVPPVTPATPASPATSTAVSSGTPEPTAAPEQSAPPPVAPPAATASVPPAAIASVPPAAPAAPAGPPAPPISQ
jgi:hypothetical protein